MQDYICTYFLTLNKYPIFCAAFLSSETTKKDKETVDAISVPITVSFVTAQLVFKMIIVQYKYLWSLFVILFVYWSFEKKGQDNENEDIEVLPFINL